MGLKWNLKNPIAFEFDYLMDYTFQSIDFGWCYNLG